MAIKKNIENKNPVQTFTKPKRELRDSEVRKEFKKYFVKLKRKLDLSGDMENVLWLHCKAAGFAKVELFDKGIANFGYRL